MTQRLNDFLVKFANDLGYETFEECPFTNEVTPVGEVAQISHPLGGFMSVTPRSNCGLLVLESDYAVYVHSVQFLSNGEVIVGPIVAQLYEF